MPPRAALQTSGAEAGSSLRLLQLTAPGRFGGLETVVRQLSSGLAGRGHDVRVVCRLDESADPAEHPFVTSLRDEGVRVDVLNLPHRAYRREVVELTALLREFEPDVVHTHGYHADVIGWRAARAAEYPRVATAHGFTGGGWKNRFYEFLQRRSFRSARTVIAVSSVIARRLSSDEALAPAVRHLQNAWVRRTGRPDAREARAALGLDPDRLVVGWVGRFSREKGPDVIVKAMSDGAAAGLTLCMVGDGTLREELRASADGGAGARIHWPGSVADAGRLFAAFDLLALSSRTEGTPMVLFEAMDAGVPIVATAVGGVPDMLGPDEALLVKPDDADALREAILAVVAEPEEARRRAERAAARLSDQFSPEPWLDAHEALYRGAIADAGRESA